MTHLSRGLYLAVVAILVILYADGLNGIFFIDDAPNLDGLLAVSDFSSAMHFVTTGAAGPLGRPVSLATFLIGADNYPGNPTWFLLINLIIHLANVLLVALMVCRLQRLLPRFFGDSRWFAPLVALFWGVLPILASTSLMMIQRMTSLSGLFVLVGVNVYLWARMNPGSIQRAVWALAGIGACTLLAALSKENGVLLPLLLLVMHGVLFARNGQVNYLVPVKLLRWGLILPSLLLLGYLCYRMPGIADAFWRRPFDVWERLATQAVVLWEYLRMAFLPTVMGLSPFRDDYPVYQFSDSIVMLALGGWLLVLMIAGGLFIKQRPLLLFAVLWFLAGHLLESSMFPLFLYFEHRNYIPLLGLVLALSAGFQRLPAPAMHKGLVAGGYFAFLAFILWQTSAMWGDRQHLVWAQAHPDSPRAVQMLAGAYVQAGRLHDADRLYERTLERNPQFSSVAMQGVRLACYIPDDGQALARWLPHAKRVLPKGEYSALTLQALEAVAQLQHAGQCHALTVEEILQLVRLLASNPVFGGAIDNARMHYLQAQLQLQLGRADLAIDEAAKALKARPDDMLSIALLYRLKREHVGQAAADRFLAKVSAEGPNTLNPWVQEDWLAAIKQIGLQGD